MMRERVHILGASGAGRSTLGVSWLRDFADANIFKPLGMTITLFRDDPSMIIRNLASGYS